MTAAQLAILLLRLAGSPVEPGPAETRARILAPVIIREATARGLDPVLVAAVAWHESRLDRNARGLAGELGYMQLKRGTRATKGYDNLSDAGLMNPGLNFYLGARHLAHVRDVCLGKRGVRAPLSWLSVYKGLRCKPSRYSRAILADIARVTAAPPTVPESLADHYRKLNAEPARLAEKGSR